MPESDDPSWKQDTRAITAGRDGGGSSLAPVLFPSTTYEVDSVDEHVAMAATSRPVHYYSRFGSPTVRDFEDAVAALEGAEAGLAFASGMAAIPARMRLAVRSRICPKALSTICVP